MYLQNWRVWRRSETSEILEITEASEFEATLEIDAMAKIGEVSAHIGMVDRIKRAGELASDGTSWVGGGKVGYKTELGTNDGGGGGCCERRAGGPNSIVGRTRTPK